MTPVGFQGRVPVVWKCADMLRRSLKQPQRECATPARPHHTAPGHP